MGGSSGAQLIIGVTGTLGAGKGCVVEYLVQKRGFKWLSVRQYLLQQLASESSAQKQCKERRWNDSGASDGTQVPDRDSLREFANELRRKNGPTYIIEQVYLAAEALSVPVVIESIRTPEEVLALRALSKQKLRLVSVDADIYQRYMRVQERKSETDNVRFDQFQEQEQKEMNGEGGLSQNIRATMALADEQIQNDGTIDELHQKVGLIVGCWLYGKEVRKI